MPTEVIMPKLGLTMKEGMIVKWLKKQGDRVELGEPLLEITSDKSTIEVEAPATGTLLSILADDGTTVPVATIIGWIGD
jgi:pyruvate/2-oxoglutarate dehydrogenase complex dihydrolipoamide acyltransferase (E2) component